MQPVIFSHGKESGPWGTKIQRLADSARRLGHPVESIDYSDTMDPDVRSQRLLDYLQNEQVSDPVLVGSSMGGYVTLQAAKQYKLAGCFVLAPAIYMPGYEHNAPDQPLTNLEIVHGWADEVVPVEHSIRFAQAQACTLHLVDDDHRLIRSLDTIDEYFVAFLRRLNAAPTAG
jgi:pimeloyl-ACP methyl ester carboxylesterase